MEIWSASHEKAGLLARGWGWIKALPNKLVKKLVEIFKNMKKIGQDDPRKLIHSLKVGLALTMLSLFYYIQPLYRNFGVSIMWAIMTVVVVFEFSVGATLGKGFNRGIGTLLAGALAIGVHHLACKTGKIAEPILLGLFVFLQAAVSTFLRFFPSIKSRYDYGVLIFILTFCLVSVSGFRNEEVLELAHKRLSTVLLGASVCVIVSIFVCPVWAGEDLHNVIVLNTEKLGNFLEGFGDKFFKTTNEEENTNNEAIFESYKSVLSSKSNEETLENFARWEPGHGHFMFRHPWKQYLKIGNLNRQCAYRIEALSGYLNSDVQVPQEIYEVIQETCTKMSVNSGKALKELALAIKTMTWPSSADIHISKSKAEAKILKASLKSGSWERIELLKVIPVATVASLLIDVLECVDNIAESVNELASLAHFRSTESSHTMPTKSQLDQNEVTKADNKADCDHVVIEVHGSASANTKNGSSQETRTS